MHRFAIKGAVLLLVLLPIIIQAQAPREYTLPLQDPKTDYFRFFDHQVVGIDYTGIKTVSAKVNGYSLDDPKFLWRQDVEVNDKSRESWPHSVSDYATNRLYLGNGPFTAIDVVTGKILWTKSCDEFGFVPLDLFYSVDDKWLLVAGSDKCKGLGFGGALASAVKDEGMAETVFRTKERNFKEPYLRLIEAATGSAKWVYASESFTWERDKGDTKVKSIEWQYYLVGDPVTAPNTAKILVSGKRMALINYADGKPVWESKNDVGVCAGRWGDLALCYDDKDLTAYRISDGSTAWKYKLESETPNIESVAHRGSSNDVFVGQKKSLVRLDLNTGKPIWDLETIPGTKYRIIVPNLFVSNGKAVICYDFESGKPKWIDEGKNSHFVTVDDTVNQTVALVENADKIENGRRFGPYKLHGVDIATGKVLWNLDKFNGKKIVSFNANHVGTLRISWDEGSEFLNRANGQPVTESYYYVRNAFRDKELRCETNGGKIAWSREAAISPKSDWAINYRLKRIILPNKNGTVEVLDLGTGESIWNVKAKGDPKIFIDDEMSPRWFVVLMGDTIKLVDLGGSSTASEPQ